MLDAREAGRLTGEALGEDAEAVRPFLEHVEGRVRDAAGKGKREVAHPFYGLKWPSPEVRDAVRRAMEARGFKWVDHPDPDPVRSKAGHPGSGPYTTVSW